MQCKGEEDLKELVENCTKTNPDQLNVMKSHSSNLDEIYLTLSAWPKQIQTELRLLQSDISSVLTEEMQVVFLLSDCQPSVFYMTPIESSVFPVLLLAGICTQVFVMHSSCTLRTCWFSFK